MTNNLERRVAEHKSGLVASFASRYNINRLVYYENISDVAAAIAREKQIKGWLRRKKVELIEAVNPDWQDLRGVWSESGLRDSSLRSE